ncbi:MAG: plasmid mobilization relaxosome protein MobC [Bacteroidota bacterium]
MEKNNKNRTRWLHIRLTELEFKKIRAEFSASTKQSLSDYSRSILLGKPITVYRRNQSFDDYVAEMILLKGELKAIGNNLNQAVKKLHTVDSDNGMKSWAITYQNNYHSIFKKMEEINLKIAELNNQWLQE